MSATTVSWKEAHKKEARGVNGYDLGEVQDTGTYYVHTQKGVGSHTQFYIPKKYFSSFDGRTVRFDVGATQANEFVGNKYPTDEEYRAKYEPKPKMAPAMAAAAAPRVIPSTGPMAGTDIVERIPIMTEHLDVSKHMHEDEVIITKTPYMENQTRDVGVMHEEIRIEEAKPGNMTRMPEAKRDMNSETIRVPVRHEDVDVTRTPEVKEEVIVHRTPVTETRHISEQVRSEKFDVNDNTRVHAMDEEKKKRLDTT
jgi:uncharacterized protein (TIGR02271 family)